MTRKMGSFYVDKEKGLLVLEDGQGNKDFFTIEEELKLHGVKYMILVPEGEEWEEGEEEAVVLRVEKDNEDKEIWSGVEDEEELAAIQEALLLRYEEDED